VAREAVRLIGARDPAKPLFLYVPFNAVHGPYQVPESYSEPYARFESRRRTYAGMVAALDEAVGQIAAAIDTAGMTANTLFIFSSDNGGPQPGATTSNGPLRAGKGTIYEGGVRTCAFATWPGHIEGGSVVRAPLHMVDWYPTLLKLAGASFEQPLPLDGRDAWPAITAGAPSPHAEIMLNATPQHGAIRMGDWKLVLNGRLGTGDGEDPKTLPAVGKNPRVELFDLAADPGEANNLADEKPQVVAELRARYDALASQAAPPKARPKARGFKVPKVWGQADQ
jgi:arylsulfatase A-like enzyme